MSRYLGSFFIAFSFYALFGVGIFYFLKNNKIIIVEDKQIKTLSLNHIEMKPMEKEIVEDKIVQKDIQKEEIIEKNEVVIEQKIVEIPTPIIKKEIKKEIEKKIVKKLEKKKTIEKKEIVKKELKETKEVKNPIKEHIVEDKIVQKDIQIEKVSKKEVIDDRKVYLDKHLIQIRNLINQNVKYPKKARKLSIQGIVLVKFKITQNGNVESITILDGHKFLQNATIEAITEAAKSFPKTNQSIEIQIPIEYRLI